MHPASCISCAKTRRLSLRRPARAGRGRAPAPTRCATEHKLHPYTINVNETTTWVAHTHITLKLRGVLPLKSNTHPAWRAAPAVAGPARAGRRAYAVLTPVSDIKGLPYLLHHGELLRLRDASEMDSTANLGSRRVYLGVR